MSLLSHSPLHRGGTTGRDGQIITTAPAYAITSTGHLPLGSHANKGPE